MPEVIMLKIVKKNTIKQLTKNFLCVILIV